jgi:alpha-tubulin suppressor-like RCC1 family protein
LGGQIGNGSSSSVFTPAKVTISNVASMAAGQLSAIALRNDGSVWDWGYNAYGEVGN